MLEWFLHHGSRVKTSGLTPGSMVSNRVFLQTPQGPRDTIWKSTLYASCPLTGPSARGKMLHERTALIYVSTYQLTLPGLSFLSSQLQACPTLPHEPQGF